MSESESTHSAEDLLELSDSKSRGSLGALLGGILSHSENVLSRDRVEDHRVGTCTWRSCTGCRKVEC